MTYNSFVRAALENNELPVRFSGGTPRYDRYQQQAPFVQYRQQQQVDDLEELYGFANFPAPSASRPNSATVDPQEYSFDFGYERASGRRPNVPPPASYQYGQGFPQGQQTQINNPNVATAATQQSQQTSRVSQIDQDVIMRELSADKQRETRNNQLLSQLINHRRRNNVSLQLCSELADGKSVPVADICNILHENAAIELAILDTVESALNIKKRANRVTFAVTFRRQLTPTPDKDVDEELDYDKRLEQLVNTLMQDDIGPKLLDAGALDEIHGHNNSGGASGHQQQQPNKKSGAPNSGAKNAGASTGGGNQGGGVSGAKSGGAQK
ncbi:UNVERIFIED_CONTAM: hypothetical protein HDU68_009006 [Siphonaria sp. JEL0065]|nr:hypothetical protein HDU68_009006 [Siphonaria sp. JEL0065]